MSSNNQLSGLKQPSKEDLQKLKSISSKLKKLLNLNQSIGDNAYYVIELANISENLETCLLKFEQDFPTSLNQLKVVNRGLTNYLNLNQSIRVDLYMDLSRISKSLKDLLDSLSHSQSTSEPQSKTSRNDIGYR